MVVYVWWYVTLRFGRLPACPPGSGWTRPALIPNVKMSNDCNQGFSFYSLCLICSKLFT